MFNPEKILKPGDKVFYIQTIAGRVRRSPRSYIVECTVTEVNNIYTHPDRNVSVWHHQFLDLSKEYAEAPTTEKNEDGWPEWEQVDLKRLEGLRLCNQILWIDEPVGHGISLGDECFLTLEEAMDYAFPTRKKHLKRNLKKVRGRVHRFIAGTWRRAGEKHPGFKPLAMKRVYVK